MGGTGQMATVWTNLTTVQQVLEVLEREAILLELLAVDVRDERADRGRAAHVRRGRPCHRVQLLRGGTGGGRLGVIGPMRMDYRRVMSVVDEISRELGDRFGS